MISGLTTEDLASYELDAEVQEGKCTIQCVRNSITGSVTYQEWKHTGELGRGAHGKVWREILQDNKGERRYRAVKQFRRCGSQQALADCQRELAVLVKFSKPPYAGLFVNIFGWFRVSEGHFLAMECMREGDLSQYISDGLPEIDIKEIMTDVLHGLKVMHQEGIVHRDIKPNNILVNQKKPEHRRWQVKIADFGLSKPVSQLQYSVVGTPSYMAPEVRGWSKEYRPNSNHSDKVDMWSLGCVLYELSTKGKLAFSDSDLFDYCEKRVLFNLHDQPLAIGNEGKSLLGAFLSLLPEQRPSAIEALQSRWLGGLFDVEAHNDSTSEKVTSAIEPSNEVRFSDVKHVAQVESPVAKVSELPPSTDRLTAAPRIAQDHQSSNDARAKTLRKVKGNNVSTKTVRKARSSDLHSAVIQGCLETVQRLINDGFAIDEKDQCEQTSLHFASRAGHMEIVKWLVQEGLRIDEKSVCGYTPLHLAAWNGHIETVKWLVDKGSRLEEVERYGRTPLQLAAATGHIDVVIWLVEQGAEYDGKN